MRTIYTSSTGQAPGPPPSPRAPPSGLLLEPVFFYTLGAISETRPSTR
jgi:hypothetical protein